ncbi:phosphotransferase [Streptomyces sp. ISL-86]|uniref:phosphotransferase n=1 Tax=Streptomyces sp. ISL-86 TaxID=2819187 RepID=UPI002034B256|nr:phosphotransferase [Streptomyces sp. ISL-86]
MRGPAKLARALHRLSTTPGLTGPGSADRSAAPGPAVPGPAEPVGVPGFTSPGPADRAGAPGLTSPGDPVGVAGLTGAGPADRAGPAGLTLPGPAERAAAAAAAAPGSARPGPGERAAALGLAFPGPGPRPGELVAVAPAEGQGGGGRDREVAPSSGAGSVEAGHPTVADAEVVRAAARTLPAWARGEAGPPDGGVLCHGDLHLGQLVRFPAPEGAWRLIDVDDLGIGTPAWDLARPAAWYAAGILDTGTWLRFLDAYRAAGGPAAGPPGSDPWPELDLAARALTVQTAALALAKAATERRRLDDVERLMMDACTRIATLPPDLEPGTAS